ncbi:serine hydrolase domain-containing protein [Paucibacter sp. APW11]|uniref:Serine hydrolase domain-containing protein n=1 Tax=Roseateles aquae TaxID=3077235 RepID=A0ABU3PFT0_9BURK|nr:serine hydrolase domain-containing protein [Paucibacter sp. APW11]MDT9001461.1 serine hydrolase domain-containing protein [Paucibacter sp. APW11]
MRTLTLLAICAGLTACASIKPELPLPLPDLLPPSALELLQTQLSDDVRAGKLVSVSYALVQRGRIVHEAAVGWADQAQQRAATPHTPYPLASLSKPLLATAVVRLSEQGRLDLDAPARRYLPELPSDFTASVRQLLMHSSGLPGYARICWRDQGHESRPDPASARPHAFAAQPPGRLFEYSNLGYGLLGQIVSAQSGQPLDRHLQQQLFAPLGMQDSSLPESYAPPEGAAHKYDSRGQQLPDTWNDTPGAGNLYASAHDLARFAAFQLGDADAAAQALLTPQNRQLMQQAAEPNAHYAYYGSARYGLGWYHRRSAQGEPLVWHEGGMPGASSLLLMLPERHLAVVVLMNSNDGNARAQSIANTLLRSVLPGYTAVSLDASDGLQAYAGDAALRGRWSGEILVDGRPLRWALRFDEHGDISAEFPDRPADSGLPQQLRFNALQSGPLLLATLPVRLPASGVSQRGQTGYLLLRLWREGETLKGSATAYAAEDRLEHLLPFPAQLRREVSP